MNDIPESAVGKVFLDVRCPTDQRTKNRILEAVRESEEHILDLFTNVEIIDSAVGNLIIILGPEIEHPLAAILNIIDVRNNAVEEYANVDSIQHSRINNLFMVIGYRMEVEAVNEIARSMFGRNRNYHDDIHIFI